jgi:hypothetical protein
MRKALAMFSVGLMAAAVSVAEAEVETSGGWIYESQVISDFADGCVAAGLGGTFVGVGPQNLSFPPPAGTRRILFVSESGAERVVATGLNSITDCVYDRATDTLFVVDNGGEFDGATTGDTVFAIASASTATDQAAAGLELLAAGSIPAGASVTFDADGNLLVSTADGPGSGGVVHIDLQSGTLSSFISDAFDFTGGIAIDVDGSILVADADGTNFKSRICRFDADGNFLELFSGPTGKHGSLDLEVTADGKILATGSGTPIGLVRNRDGRVRKIATGLGDPEPFGGSVDTDPITGRATFLASSFSGAEGDRSLHHLIRVNELEPGAFIPLRDDTECLLEFYGVDFEPFELNQRVDIAECVDGDPSCDADGIVNDECVFPVGFCVGVKDNRYRRCAPLEVAEIELLSEGREELLEPLARAQAALPIEPGIGRCFVSEGVTVPLKITKRGIRRPQRLAVRMRVLAAPPSMRTDRDEMRLGCLPPPEVEPGDE